jgi:hypothetical protein
MKLHQPDWNPLHDPEGYSILGLPRLALGALMVMWLFDRLQCGICGPNRLPGRCAAMVDKAGGDWDERPEDLRVRDWPQLEGPKA